MCINELLKVFTNKCSFLIYIFTSSEGINWLESEYLRPDKEVRQHWANIDGCGHFKDFADDSLKSRKIKEKMTTSGEVL